MSPNRTVVGWDVGGAHLKVARLDADGRLDAVRIVACPLWRGVEELERAIDAVADLVGDAPSAVTMTGELADLWPDRASGVAAIVATLVGRLGAERLAVYAGDVGFLPAAAAPSQVAAVASANWRATAEALASAGGAGLLVDVGSTTSDLVPFANGRVLARAATDAARMAADELVYMGVVRTPVMALTSRLPFEGAWVSPMAEFFSTASDAHRLNGDLREGADLYPAADGGDKTAEGSARRLLRMVGADLDSATRPAARKLARHLAEAQLRRLHDAADSVLSRPECAAIDTIVGAGVGRFLSRRLANRLDFGYRDIGAAFADDESLAGVAADCAPAVAVARLWAFDG